MTAIVRRHEHERPSASEAAQAPIAGKYPPNGRDVAAAARPPQHRMSGRLQARYINDRRKQSLHPSRQRQDCDLRYGKRRAALGAAGLALRHH